MWHYFCFQKFTFSIFKNWRFFTQRKVQLQRSTARILKNLGKLVFHKWYKLCSAVTFCKKVLKRKVMLTLHEYKELRKTRRDKAIFLSHKIQLSYRTRPKFIQWLKSCKINRQLQHAELYHFFVNCRKMLNFWHRFCKRKRLNRVKLQLLCFRFDFKHKRSEFLFWRLFVFTKKINRFFDKIRQSTLNEAFAKIYANYLRLETSSLFVLTLSGEQLHQAVPQTPPGILAASDSNVTFFNGELPVTSTVLSHVLVSLPRDDE